MDRTSQIAGRTSARRGFTLVEILVAMAILVTISAVSAPVLLSYLQKQRVQQTREMLEALGQGITSFRLNTQHNPGALGHLSTMITNSQTNSCGVGYPTGAVSNWAGPYSNRLLPATGVMTPIGRLSNTLIRTPTTASAGTLALSIETVQLMDAELLNAVIDADLSSTGGAVRWSAPNADGFVTVQYLVPVNGC